MITATGMSKSLFIFESARVMSINEDQMPVWLELISTANPRAEDDDLMQATRNICTRHRTTQEWVAVPDVLTEISKIRHRNLELAEKYARQIERAGTDVSDDNMRQIMVDTGAGLDAVEVAERARKRAES